MFVSSGESPNIAGIDIQSDLFYPNSLEFGLWNMRITEMIEDVTRKCVRIVRHTDERNTD